MLNEIVFYHATSSTLIVADAYYTGYCHQNQNRKPPSPFTRIWFKMTKDHWSSAQLPIYRTARVLSNGKPDLLLTTLRSISEEWEPKQMVCAHGDRVVTNDPGKALIRAWTEGVGRKKTSHA